MPKNFNINVNLVGTDDATRSIESELEGSPDIPRNDRYEAIGKRVLDIAIAMASLITLGPLIILLAIIVSRDGYSPFFSHTRVGRYGRKFGCLKIRTMVPNAEKKLEELLKIDAVARQEWEESRKLTDDPRVTSFGHFLRRTSLDELPQIWNILIGEMSVVGPRPVTHSELTRYGHRSSIYLSMRPGLTGLWQVGGRNDVSYNERVDLDARYHRSMSFSMDIKIIFATFVTIFVMTGR